MTSWMKNQAPLAAAMLMLAACTTEIGAPVPKDVADQFQNGVATYNDVIQLLGAPTDYAQLSNAQMQINYKYTKEYKDDNYFVPFAGPLIGKVYTTTILTSFIFAQDGLLLNHKTVSTDTQKDYPFLNLEHE